MNRLSTGVKVLVGVEIGCFVVQWMILLSVGQLGDFSALGAIPLTILLELLAYVSLVLFVRAIVANWHDQPQPYLYYAAVLIGPVLDGVNRIAGISFPNFDPPFRLLGITIAVIVGIILGHTIRKHDKRKVEHEYFR